MAEFIDIKEKTVDVGDLVLFENKTDLDYAVSAGIIFKKSGVYEVTIVGNKTIVTKVTERKKGRWLRITQGAVPEKYMCPFCRRTIEDGGVENLLSVRFPFCHCGADMRGEQT